MACGTPVIAFNRGSMPELIDDGVTGFLVDDVDGRLAAVGGRRLDRPRSGHAVGALRPRRMVDEYLAAYEAVLTCSRR